MGDRTSIVVVDTTDKKLQLCDPSGNPIVVRRVIGFQPPKRNTRSG